MTYVLGREKVIAIRSLFVDGELCMWRGERDGEGPRHWIPDYREKMMQRYNTLRSTPQLTMISQI